MFLWYTWGMIHITIKATGIELTPAIRAYVEEKVAHVDKLIPASDTTAHADVEVGQTTKHHQSGNVFRTEINLVSKQGSFRIEIEEADLYASIDRAKDELMDEIRDRKDKKVSLVRRGQRLFKRMLGRAENEE